MMRKRCPIKHWTGSIKDIIALGNKKNSGRERLEVMVPRTSVSFQIRTLFNSEEICVIELQNCSSVTVQLNNEIGNPDWVISVWKL